MKFLIAICAVFLFVSCLTEEQQAEIAAADSPVVQESEVDTFVVGGKGSLAGIETPEGESLRLDNDTAIQSIRDAIGGSNTETNIDPSLSIVKNPDEGPSFPGGGVAMDKFIAAHLIYPLVAFQNDVRGTVNVCFVVEPDGKLTGIVVLQGIGFGCDEAAVDLIKSMPKWNPGKKGGVNVRCSVVLPIAFRTPE